MLKNDRVWTIKSFEPRPGAVLMKGTRGRIVEARDSIQGRLYEVQFDGIGLWAVPGDVLELEPVRVTMTSSRWERQCAADDLLRDRVALLLESLERVCKGQYPEDIAIGIRAVSEALRHSRAAASTVPAPPSDESWRKDWPEGWPGCAQATCKEPAAFGYVWPGKGRLHACFTHITRVIHVAEALGLTTRSLEIDALIVKDPK